MINQAPDAFVRDEVGKTVAVLSAVLADAAVIEGVARAGALCIAALRKGNRILLAGNGGSAADAQHIASELVGRLNVDRPGLAALSLTADTSVLTALGDDYGYEEIFRRQVEALGTDGDVLIALSTSGRSRNLVQALATARAKGMVTIGMTGATGGDMLALCDRCLSVPSRETQRVQEAHIVLGHIVCSLVERAMFPQS